MANLLIRNLDDAVYEELKAQAKANHRSISAEARVILSRGIIPEAEAAAPRPRKKTQTLAKPK